MWTAIAIAFVSAFLYLSDWVLCKVQETPFKNKWKFENCVLPIMVIVQDSGSPILNNIRLC
jgi:hypothetical protein